jgi:hypothetical protein
MKVVGVRALCAASLKQPKKTYRNTDSKNHC